MLGCRVLGHRYRFSADGRVMRWDCARGCGAGGKKVYDTPAQAARYAAAFDEEDRDKVTGHPTVTMIPLWIARKLTGRRRDTPS
jgi:hypothetical protein